MGVVGAAATALVGLLAGPAGAAATGTVTVVHGLPGVVADVTVDGKQVLGNFAPERITAPMTLPAGVHQFEVRKSGTSPTSPPAVSGKVVIKAGSRASLAVGLGAAGKPAAHLYDDAQPTGAGADGSAVVVRSVASGDPVRVALDGSTLDGALANNDQAKRTASVGQHTLSIAAASGVTVLAPQGVPVLPRGATVLYLVGKTSSGGLTLLAEQVPNDPTATPVRVSTGNSGLADRRSSPPSWAIVLAGLAVAIGAGAAAARVARARGTRRTGLVGRAR